MSNDSMYKWETYETEQASRWDTRLKSSIKTYRVGWYVALALLVFVVVYFVFRNVGLSISNHYKTIDVAGQFGDSFGYVNALFSAFAFAGVILALFVQIAEFHLAQEERTDNLKIQKRISDQQYFASIVSAISTWQNIHRRDCPKMHKMNANDIRCLARRKKNDVLLDVATEYMMSIETGDDSITLFVSDRRYHDVVRQVDRAKDVANICINGLYNACRHIDAMFGETGTINRQHAEKEIRGALILALGIWDECKRQNDDDPTFLSLLMRIQPVLEELQKEVNESKFFTNSDPNSLDEDTKAVASIIGTHANKIMERLMWEFEHPNMN